MAYTDINSEDRLVQKTFADHLRDVLGWESIVAADEREDCGVKSGGTVLRMNCLSGNPHEIEGGIRGHFRVARY